MSGLTNMFWQNYDRGVPTDSAGLVAYYKFDEPSADDARSYQRAVDSTINNNHGRVMT